jgi:hypothetical protein
VGESTCFIRAKARGHTVTDVAAWMEKLKPLVLEDSVKERLVAFPE